MIDYGVEAPAQPETKRSEQQTAHWLTDTAIVSTPKKWYLCSMSEAYLNQSFTNGGIVTVVNDTLVVKPFEKLAGLCIRDVKGPTGNVLFQKGYWYAPVGKCRQDLLDNFDSRNKAADGKGKTRMSLAKSQWCLMRIAKPYDDQTLEEYIQTVIDTVSELQPTFQVTPFGQETIPETHDYLWNHRLAEFDRGTRIDDIDIRERLQMPHKELEFEKNTENNFSNYLISNNFEKQKKNLDKISITGNKYQKNIIEWENIIEPDLKIKNNFDVQPKT